MAWIELHDTLPDHTKVLDLSAALKMDKDAVVGKLIRLWVWALNNREDGLIRTRDVPTVGDVMRIKGKAEKVIAAMVKVRLLDPVEGGYMIHGWDEHVHRLMETRERNRAQARERKRRQRANEKSSHENVTRDMRDENPACHAATVPKPYQDDDEDTNNSLSCARAQEVIHRISTEEVERAYRDYVGRAPTPAEMEAMLNRVDAPELIVEAIKRAALNGGKSVCAYVGKELAQWYRAGLETVEQLEAWEEKWRDPFEQLNEMEDL